MTYRPDMMIYHADCADGFGAAWAAWELWGDTVEYMPYRYGQTPPDVMGKHVLIGDFSFKRDQLAHMADDAASIIVLDHHKSAQADLAEWIINDPEWEFVARGDPLKLVRDNDDRTGQPIAALFDMERSGARMVWDFCFPGIEAPVLIQLIEDRDLWRFKLPDTKPFGLWLRSEPFSFARWNEIAGDLVERCAGGLIMREASAMQRFHDRKVEEMLGRIRHIRIDGHVVPACNCPPEFASEVAHAILDKHKEAPFAATYSDGPKGRGYSLRSDYGENRIDVSEIAQRYGGGGHRNAAGFAVPLP